MPTKHNCDLKFRPSSYWQVHVSSASVAESGGELVRRTVRALIRTGRLVDVERRLLREKFSDDERRVIVRIRPMLMSGGYLPDREVGEVEIARVAVKSTTGNVFSIRARRSGQAICYRVVDEYETLLQFEPTRTSRPLTMGQLIALIGNVTEKDGGYRGLMESFRDVNLKEGSGNPEHYADFVVVTSEFYPELQSYYEAEARAWV